MVPYSHNPPGHTCGLPCCNEELQIQLRVRRPKSCIGFQNVDEVLQDNFTFRRGKLLKDRPVLENGFFSVQQAKETQRAAIPKFGSLSKCTTKTNNSLGRHNFLKGREIALPETKEPDATNKLYLEDFYTGESDDLLDVSSDKDIEYYMSVKPPDGPDKGVPYSPKDLEEKEIYPWDLMLELKMKTSQSEKTDDTTSSNYYEVLNYADSIQSSSENEKSNDGPPLPVKRVKKFPIAEPLPEVPPKVPLQNLFNHPPLRKLGSEKPTSQTLENVKPKPTGLDKSTNKYNTYNSLHSINCEKKKLEHQGNQKYMSLDRSYSGKKRRKDARDIDFQVPKMRFKDTTSPKANRDEKKKKQFKNIEKENQHFNIMLNSELIKLKKFFHEEDDTKIDESKSQTNDGFMIDNGDEVFQAETPAIDNPVTLILWGTLWPLFIIRQYRAVLTLALLNKLRCHAHF